MFSTHNNQDMKQKDSLKVQGLLRYETFCYLSFTTDPVDFSGHIDNHLEYFFSSIKNTHLSTVSLGQPVGGIAWHPRKSYLAVGHDQTVSVHHIPNKMLI